MVNSGSLTVPCKPPVFTSQVNLMTFPSSNFYYDKERT